MHISDGSAHGDPVRLITEQDVSEYSMVFFPAAILRLLLSTWFCLEAKNEDKNWLCILDVDDITAELDSMLLQDATSTNMKQLECPKCGSRFKSQRGLKSHFDSEKCKVAQRKKNT